MAFPKKISELPASGVLKNTDLFVTVNNDITSKTTLGEIAASISGGSSTFTGNTSATCINQLWVHSMSGCSPIQMGEIVVNGETTFNGNVNLSPDSQTNIDFDNADAVSIPTYVLKDCKGNENDITTLQNFSEYIGQVITLASEGDTRWEVTLQPTFEVTSIEECCFDNFKISNCDTGELWNIVNWEAWPGSGFIGTIIKIEAVEGCFSVSATCEEWTLDEKVLVSGEYETCIECTTTPFTLNPCEGWPPGIIFTNTDLSAYVGGVIKELETGICYIVEDCVGLCEPTIPILYEELTYGECIECKFNWELRDCISEEIIGITTTQSGLWEPAPTTFTASTIDGCFHVDKIQKAATMGEVLDIGLVENCENWPCTNFVLLNCGGDILGITSQNLTAFADGSYYSGSNTTHSFSGQCFTIEISPEEADLSPLDTSDWGVVENCDLWPCSNFMIEPCTEGVGVMTVHQDLNEFLFDVAGILTGTTFEDSLCFTVSATQDPPDTSNIDTSSWGSLGIEIDDCGEDPPCQSPPVEELSLNLIQEPGTPNWTVTLTSNIGDTGVAAFQLTIGDEGILFEEGERGEIVPLDWEFSAPAGGNSNICFNFSAEEFTLNEESIIATWVLNTPDIITSLSLVSVNNGAGIPYSVGVTIG
tara:strand:+ start:2031 stop:3974 length:1944 start_codon:yes stop_codon:yes gene_type:complete